MWNLRNKINEQTKQKQTHRYREKTGDCQMGSGVGGLGEKGEEIKKHKLVVKNSHKDVTYSTGNIVITIYSVRWLLD